jgi:cytochrome c biogenesis protein CcdA/glutaredoxin
MKERLGLLLVLILLLSSFVSAQDVNHSVEGHEEIVDVVYFYGIGCPHCEELEEFLDEIKDDYNLNLVGYEVYQNESNRELAKKLAEEYGDSFRGVPMTFVGDKIFIGFSDRIRELIEGKIQSCTEECCDSPLEKVKACEIEDSTKEKLTLASIITLAIADSVNPCALAILSMALIALLVQDPRKKRRVIYGGLAFTAAVFITYIFYGIVIIQSFKFLAIYFARAYGIAKIIFAFLAIFVGVMNIKDYLHYTPGTVGTEMPMFMRPIAKSLIKNITRPRGAFIIGILVTLFLLPCTIGPYVVVGNLLSAFELVKSLPWLIFYNIIFVLPMIGITILVYLGYTTVEKVSGWKEDNVRYLHLVAGIVLVLLGLVMLFGII